MRCRPELEPETELPIAEAKADCSKTQAVKFDCQAAPTLEAVLLLDCFNIIQDERHRVIAQTIVAWLLGSYFKLILAGSLIFLTSYSTLKLCQLLEGQQCTSVLLCSSPYHNNVLMDCGSKGTKRRTFKIENKGKDSVTICPHNSNVHMLNSKLGCLLGHPGTKT